MVTESLDFETVGERTPGSRIPTIRGGMVLPERASEAYIEALDEITAIAGADGTWSKFTVDDVLWEHIAKALQVSPEEDLLVYGMDVSCADLTFGGLTFFSDEVSVENEYSSGLADFPSGNQMFARLETTAIDVEWTPILRQPVNP